MTPVYTIKSIYLGTLLSTRNLSVLLLVSTTSNRHTRMINNYNPVASGNSILNINAENIHINTRNCIRNFSKQLSRHRCEEKLFL